MALYVQYSSSSPRSGAPPCRQGQTRTQEMDHFLGKPQETPFGKLVWPTQSRLFTNWKPLSALSPGFRARRRPGPNS